MADRRIIIGAIGGDRQAQAAREFGASVARAGCILLTGGEHKHTDQVKDIAMVGAAAMEAEGALARLVGIIPNGPARWDTGHPRRLFLHTGVGHNIRNVINALTPDVVVVFGAVRGRWQRRRSRWPLASLCS